MKRALGISVHYVGPSKTRCGRVVARCNGRRIVCQWNLALSRDANYDAAAEALLAQLKTGSCAWYWNRAKLLRVQSDVIMGYVFAVVTPE